MEAIIVVLTLISLLLAHAYLKKASVVRGGNSVISIASMQINELKRTSLHNYWTCCAMAIMQRRECSFEEAVILLKLGNFHPHVDWDEVVNAYDAVIDRAAIMSSEFDSFIKEEVEVMIKEKSNNHAS